MSEMLPTATPAPTNVLLVPPVLKTSTPNSAIGRRVVNNLAVDYCWRGGLAENPATVVIFDRSIGDCETGQSRVRRFPHPENESPPVTLTVDNTMIRAAFRLDGDRLALKIQIFVPPSRVRAVSDPHGFTILGKIDGSLNG